MESKNTVYVPYDKYIEILGFTSYCFFTGKISKYSGMAGGRMRTLGEYIENFLYGKVAEEAFKIFLLEKLELHTLTEIDVADFYLGTYLPDIVSIKPREHWVKAKFWIDVKEVRRDQKWLLVSASSTRARPYDAYVAVWVGLPEDHIIWLAENVPDIKKKMSDEWLDKVEEIRENIFKIPCKICGFATWDEVDSVNKKKDDELGRKGGCYFDGDTALFDPYDTSWSGAVVRENIGFALESLKKESNWDELKSLLQKNERIIPKVSLPLTKSGKLSKRSGLPQEYITHKDFREGYQAYFTDQLDDIERNFKNIQRSKSWFLQKLS